MDFERYRRLFPITSKRIYLNHAAISPLSTRVTDRLEWYIDDRTFGNIDSFQEADKIRDKLRALIAQMIHAEPGQIAFITNTSEGFNHLVQGLTWREGDEILVPDCEFPSNVYPFKNLERQGVVVKLIPTDEGKISLETIEAMITDKTRLLTISYVEFLSGFRNDLKAIGELCKSREIIFSVDGIQGFGALPIDVREFNIDFLSNGGHKWLMGPMGAGFMYFSPDLFQRLHPAFTGWLAVNNAWDFFDYQLDFLPDAKRYEYGTANFMGIVGLSASVELLNEIGLTNIEQKILQLGERLVDGLQEIGLKLVNTPDKKHWAGIYTFRAKETEKLFEYLKSNQVVCSVRNGMLRISPHFYNTYDEIDVLVNLINKFYQKQF